MAWNRPYCLGQHAMNSLCLSPDMEHNLQQQQVSKEFDTKFISPQTPLCSTWQRNRMTQLLLEGDQVVPSFQRLAALEGLRDAKPLPPPPPPDPEELMADEAADSEVEFFTSDQRRLLPKSCPAKSPCHPAPSRAGFRGQINYAFQENPSEGGHDAPGRTPGCTARPWAGAGVGVGVGASSWTGCEVNVSTAGFGASGWTMGGVESVGRRGQQPPQRAEQRDTTRGMSSQRDTARGTSSQRDSTRGTSSQRDTARGTSSQRDSTRGTSSQPDFLRHPRQRHSYSGSGALLHHLQPRGSCSPSPLDKPVVPPRIPIPPKPSKTTAVNPCPLQYDEDKPPKIPPRVPLVPPCPPPRTPSPKSLPLYVNGVMPPTQSFAPNPKYVRKAPQRRHSERVPPTVDQTSSTPCIVPIMRDGRQASSTHYFLLPRRPAYMDRLERFLSEPPGGRS